MVEGLSYVEQKAHLHLSEIGVDEYYPGIAYGMNIADRAQACKQMVVDMKSHISRLEEENRDACRAIAVLQGKFNLTKYSPEGYDNEVAVLRRKLSETEGEREGYRQAVEILRKKLSASTTKPEQP
jgi:hypothetical protein